MNLALRLKATAAEVIKKLMMMGVMATVNDVIDFDTASSDCNGIPCKSRKRSGGYH